MKKSTERIIIASVVIVIVLIVLAIVRVGRDGQPLREILGNRFQKNTATTNNSTNTATNTTTNTTSNTASNNTTTPTNTTGSTGTPGLAYGNYSLTMTWGGVSRTYGLHVSRKTDTKTALPLVISLHGGGGTGSSQEALTHMNLFSDQQGFLVATPDGVNQNWNDGRTSIASKTNNADDVGFLVALIDEINKKSPVDKTKVYAMGISNGGMMAHRLACEKPEVFAAVAPVSSALTTDLKGVCNPSRAISIIMIQGTEDPLIPYNGGDINLLAGRAAGPFTERGAVVAAEETLKFWQAKDACGTQSGEIGMANTNGNDGTTTTRQASSCANGSVVQFLKVTGGGHTWPGGLQYLGERLIGKTSRDFDASQVIWDFFKQFSR